MNTILTDLIEQFKKDKPNAQIIFLYKAGSHFFGMNGPNSDTDYKGVYIDPTDDSFAVKDNKNHVYDRKTNDRGGKNSSSDTDFTLFSLSTYLNLLKKADFNCMEMLYTPEDKILIDSPLFQEVREQRLSLTVRNASAFLGFAGREFKDCGLSEGHQRAINTLLGFLRNIPNNDKLLDHSLELKELIEQNKDDLRLSRTYVNNGYGEKAISAIKVAERLFTLTQPVKNVISELEKVLKKGTNEKNQMKVTHKTIYHALRCAYEGIELLETGKLQFPFDKETHDYLYAVKEGRVDKQEAVNRTHEAIKKLDHLRDTLQINNKQVFDKIDRIIFNLKGRMEVGQRLKR